MIKIPSFADFNVTKHTAILKNGLKVALFEKPGAPISIELSFLSGYRFDPVGKEGLAHFTEHVILSGTKNFPSNEAMATFIGGLGGDYNAFTGSDMLAILVSLVEEEDFPQAVTLIDEIINRPLIDAKTIETERASILQELARIESVPGEYLSIVEQGLYFQGTLCSRPGLGTKSTIAAITKKDMVSYNKKMLTSGRAQMTICGGISMDKVVNILEKGLTIRKSENFVIGGPLPVIRKKAIKIENYKTNDQLSISFGFRACPMFTEDQIPLIVLASIFSGGFASSLYRRLRSEKGLVYFVDAGYCGGYDFGSFSVTTEMDKKNLQEVLDIICDEFRRSVQGNITNKELLFHKQQGIKSQKRNMETSDSWVAFHSYGELVGDKDRLTLPEYLKQVNNVTINDITRVAKKYFTKDSWYLAICGNIKEKEIVINYK